MNKKTINRFIFWRTDFVGIAMIISGIIFMLNNFNLITIQNILPKDFIISRILGVLFIMIGIIFLFFQGAGGKLFWLWLPSGFFLTIGFDILIIGINNLFNIDSSIAFSLGIGLTFLTIFLFRKKHWWALIPSGISFGFVTWIILMKSQSIIGYHPVVLIFYLSLSFLTIFIFSVQKQKKKWALLTGAILFAISLLYFLIILIYKNKLLLSIILIILGFGILIFLGIMEILKRKKMKSV
jgi:hypothetical protein